jgi:hypothetical protein
MKYQILKQFIPGNDSVWVGAIGESDKIEIFDTFSKAETRLAQLQASDPTRGFKIIEVQS